MGKSDFFKDGDFNAICDICGQKFKGSSLRKQWDGLMVCRKDWSPRHPQEFVRGRKDNQSTPFTRNEATDVFTASATALVVPPWTYD
jgi:hypothetical protein